MDVTHAETLDEVREVLVSVLGIEDRAAGLDASTPLLESLPELDSMAVLELVAAIEERFGFTVDDGDVTAELFQTLGSLAAFVADRRP
ncbi:phosphopantetheine-binding protein [Micromonospora sp. C28SCA-DRY-2]|uniref:acyl carrier protein n=1 Tax=Micromonospora sp. C28SCA-DRY-2 TaxID=3059522 RepID=UPI002674D3F3|nr:phosphopantetheine-binding protein [Micromonospora sp. C28SCA-DRY-2]MDO3704296.1 phosphopantetheine-binding protein [Micromonospora sp. C28SCA-DRY-2]